MVPVVLPRADWACFVAASALVLAWLACIASASFAAASAFAFVVAGVAVVISVPGHSLFQKSHVAESAVALDVVAASFVAAFATASAFVVEGTWIVLASLAEGTVAAMARAVPAEVEFETFVA